MLSFLRQHATAVGLSVGLHAAILTVLLAGLPFSSSPRPRAPLPSMMALEATVVDEGAIQREIERLAELERQEVVRQQEEERQAREQAEQARREREEEQARLEQARRDREEAERVEQERLTALQRQREEETQQLAEQQRLRQQEEQQRQEAERRRIAEEERLARVREEEEQRRREEERRQREEAERLAREQEERRRREEEERRLQAEAEAEMRRVMQAEEERRRAEQAGLLDQYQLMIQRRIEQNWIPPATARPGLECVVNVMQIPSGEVVDVRVGRCNGDEAVVRSIEAAVRRASPLPRPPNAALFERNLVVTFRPDVSR